MRFVVLFASLSAAVLALPVAAAAQMAPPALRPPMEPPASAPAPKPPKPSRPSAEAPRRDSLNELFERLAAAADENEAKGVAGLIERRLGRSGSDTADLLMSRAEQAMRDKNYPLAIEILDRALVLESNWAEAWYRRATAFFLLDDPISALVDLRRAIASEPRHFEAWTALAHLFMRSEDKKRALEAYKRSLALYPHQTSIKTVVERLGREVEGLDL